MIVRRHRYICISVRKVANLLGITRPRIFFLVPLHIAGFLQCKTGNFWRSCDPEGKYKCSDTTVDIGVSIRLFDQPCSIAKWIFDRNEVVRYEWNRHLPTMRVAAKH